MKIDSQNRKIIRILFVIVFVVMAMIFTTVYSSAASTTNVSVKNATGEVNAAKGTKLRSKADSTEESKVILKLKDNTSLTIMKEVFKSTTSTAKKDIWYYVEAKGKKGYVRADKIDNINYSTVYGWVKYDVNYRTGAGTDMTLKGTLKKDSVTKIYLKAKPVSSTKGGSSTWYKIKKGSEYYYIVSPNIKLMPTSNIYENMTDDEFTTYLKVQGFDSSYRKIIKKLHKVHPNWEFVGKKMPVSWDDAVKAQDKSGVSKEYKKKDGKWDWYEASKKVVAYYLDPRNFLDEKYAFMFETLSYNSKYQTEKVVDKVLSGTYLEKYKFKAEYFVTYGKEFDISPVHVASRARQETGGADSIAINGKEYSPSKDKEKKKVYNPFNIGATDSLGVKGGLKYAYEHEWFTKKKAIKGGTEFLADGYINAGQNTIYFERFNFVNRAASHQYMTNIKAPYSESSSTFNSYKNIGLTKKPFTFIIPIYSSMPDSTEL